jgi:hypothetical protein
MFPNDPAPRRQFQFPVVREVLPARRVREAPPDLRAASAMQRRLVTASVLAAPERRR